MRATSTPASLRSAISCAMRVSARCIATAFRMGTVSGICSLPDSRDRLKGAGWKLRFFRGLPAFAPFGAVLDDPIRQRPLESDVAARLFRLDPLVLEDLLAL